MVVVFILLFSVTFGVSVLCYFKMFSITPVVLLLFKIRGCHQRASNVCSTYNNPGLID